MGKKFAQRQQRREELYGEVVAQWSTQIIKDAIVFALNEPAVMGKGVFGRGRLIGRIMPGIERYAAQIHVGLEKSPEAEYMRIKTDEGLRRILGDDAPGWAERYRYYPSDEVRK